MKKLFFVLLILAPMFSRSQIITTFAGSGSLGYTGDGGPATAASINNPGYVILDGSDNVYIADEGNNVIRKVTASGTISTIAGNSTGGYFGDGGPATAAHLSLPKGIAFDTSDNLYIADASNYVVRKINTSGIISTIAGNNINGYTGDNGPATAAELSDIHAVAVDVAGNVYIADFSNHVVRKVNTSGIISTVAGTGTLGYTGDNGPATAAELYNPSGLAFDTAGNLYIADARSEAVRRVNTAGIITTFAGNGTMGYTGDGGSATAAEFYLPHAVSLDWAGNVYICDAGNNVIRKVTVSGIVNTIAGNGAGGYSGDGVQATATSLNSPYGTAVDGAGNIYIADLSNNRIRKIIAGSESIQTYIETNGVNVFPNPVQNVLTINSTDKISSVEILNFLGQKVYSQPQLSNYQQVRIDITDLPPSIYFVRINSTEVRKFVKE